MVKEAYSDIGCRVTVTVESIFDFGIFVRLDNGARGYIRRRNLSLSGEDHPSKTVSKGQFIFVEVIEPANDDRILELSLKDTLQDPWCDPKHKVELGEITRCRVKRIVRNGVIAEIVPGLDGFHPP